MKNIVIDNELFEEFRKYHCNVERKKELINKYKHEKQLVSFFENKHEILNFKRFVSLYNNTDINKDNIEITKVENTVKVYVNIKNNENPIYHLEGSDIIILKQDLYYIEMFIQNLQLSKNIIDIEWYFGTHGYYDVKENCRLFTIEYYDKKLLLLSEELQEYIKINDVYKKHKAYILDFKLLIWLLHKEKITLTPNVSRTLKMNVDGSVLISESNHKLRYVIDFKESIETFVTNEDTLSNFFDFYEKYNNIV